MAQLAYSNETFSHSGPIAIYRAKSDAGSDLEFAFCANCGSPLFKFTSKAADVVFVNAGSLDDPTIFEPQHEVFGASRLPWDG